MRILLGFFLLFFSVAGQSAGDSHPGAGKNQPTSSPIPRSVAIQTELEVLSGTAEDIYDLAKMSKWHKTRKKLDELKRSEKGVRLVRGDDNDFFSLRLRKKIEDLEQAVSAKNRKDTMHLANSIKLLEVAMIGDLKPRVPTNVLLLDYCGHEMEILSEEKDSDKLSNLVVRMHLIWQNLIPQLIDKGDTKEIKNFSEIMKRLERAKTSEEYSQSARQVLDEVDNLEKVFKKNPK